MEIVAGFCAILLIWLIPNQIWKGLFYVGLVLLVGTVGWFSLVAYIASL